METKKSEVEEKSGLKMIIDLFNFNLQNQPAEKVNVDLQVNQSLNIQRPLKKMK